MSRSRNKRVRVKTLSETLGRFQPSPQAQVGTFQYMAPSKPSGSTDTTQLGEALSKLGAVGLDFTNKQIDAKTESDKKAGAISAKKDGLKSLATSRQGVDALIKAGYLSKEDSAPFKNAYLAQVGENFAKSQGVVDILKEGAIGEATEFYYAKIFGKTDPKNTKEDALETIAPFETFNEVAEHIIKTRLEDLANQLGTNQVARDIGFYGAIEPAVDEAMKEFVAAGKKVFLELNDQAVNQQLTNLFSLGDAESGYRDAVFWFSEGYVEGDKPDGKTVQEALENVDNDTASASFVYRNLTTMTPRESVSTESRQFFFNAVAHHVEEILGYSEERYYDKLSQINKAIEFVTKISEEKEPRTNRLVRAGNMSKKYHTLINSLYKKQAEEEEAILAKKADAQVAVGEYAQLLSTLVFVNKNNPNKSFRAVDSGDMISLIKVLKEGNLLVDGKPVLWQVRSKDNPYGPTSKVFENWNDIVALEGAIETMSEIRAHNNEMEGHKNAQIKQAEEKLSNEAQASLTIIRETLRNARGLKKGETGLPPVLLNAIDKEITRLENFSKNNASEYGPLVFDVEKFTEDAIGVFNSDEFKSNIPVQRPDLPDIYNYINQNYPILKQAMDSNPFGLEYHFSLKGWTGPEINKVISELRTQKATADKLFNFEGGGGTTGNTKVKTMVEFLTGSGSSPSNIGPAVGLQKFLRNSRELHLKRGLGGPNNIGNATSLEEDILTNEITKIMGPAYRQIVQDTLKLYSFNMEQAKEAIHAQMYQAKDEPVIRQINGQDVTLRERPLMFDIAEWPSKQNLIHKDAAGKDTPVRTWEEWITSYIHQTAKTAPVSPSKKKGN